MVAMLAETRGSMANLSQELAEAGQYLAAIEPTMAHLRIDLADPDDSLFSAGREALNRNNFRDAVRLFEQLRTDYPRSNFVPSAMYWEAFSRYRLGGTDNLRQARQLLQNQIDRYPNANTQTRPPRRRGSGQGYRPGAAERGVRRGRKRRAHSGAKRPDEQQLRAGAADP